MVVPLVLFASVTLGALLYVARPLFRGPGSPPAVRVDADAARRLELVEERDRAVAALKELEFDHRTGKVSDRDYRKLIGPLRTRAVETLRSLEPAVPAERTARRRRERRPRVKERT